MKSSQDYSNIRYAVRQAVATITLHRPESLNAMTHDLMAELKQAVDHVNSDTDVRALILTGAGRGFCSGQDLTSRLPPDADIEAILMDAYFPAIDGLRKCRVPTIAAVNGVAAGAGFSLALACDFMVAGRSARFAQSFSRIGLVPDLGSSYALPRAIGRSRALQLMMTGELISAQCAQDWGLTIETVDDDQLLEWTHNWMLQLAQGPTHALRKTRDLVDAAQHHSFEDQFRLELQVQNEIRKGPDVQERITAFLKKRSSA